jgi:polygalacturonase
MAGYYSSTEGYMRLRLNSGLFFIYLGYQLFGNPITGHWNPHIDNLPFSMSMPEISGFPDTTFNILNFGAVGDGNTLNTEAFQSAIQTCAETGGGHVVVPAGMWLLGSIELRSDVDLHIEKGAVLLFSDQYDDYPLIETHWEGQMAVRSRPSIYGNQLDHVAITGEGIIDGAGEAWRPVKRFKMTDRQWTSLVSSGGVVENGNVWWPTQAALTAPEKIHDLIFREQVSLSDYEPVRSYLRPVMIGLVRCKQVLLSGPTFQNSPAWNIHPLMCENVIIHDIKVRNPWYSQNGDGLDVESCSNVLISDCWFDVGDDAICLKSGKDEQGRKRGMPSQNIIITDCTVYHGHGGFVVGSEMSGGVRNVLVRRCTFLGTDVGLRFKSTRGRGGVVENIFIDEIRMKNIPTDAIRFNMYYNYEAPIPEDGDRQTDMIQMQQTVPVTVETPRFRKIYMKNIICMGSNRAIFLQGLPEMPINEIYMDNIFIKAEEGLTCIDADQVQLTSVRLIAGKTPVYRFENSRNITMQELDIDPDWDVPFYFTGTATKNIMMQEMNTSAFKHKIKFGKNVDPDNVSCL